MFAARSPLRLLFIVVPLLTLTMVSALRLQRAALDRLNRISAIDNWSVASPAPDRTGPTGWVNQVRQQIFPADPASAASLVRQLQEPPNDGDPHRAWTYQENAPLGRARIMPWLHAAWLRSLAGAIGLVTPNPPAANLTRAALWSGPVLQLGLILFGAIWLARRSAPWWSLVWALGLTWIPPLSAEFQPGHDPGVPLTLFFTAIGIGLWTNATPARAPATLAVTAGVATALGIWSTPAAVLPVMGGLCLGGLANRSAPPSWRPWSLAVAGTLLLACWADRGESLVNWRPELITPWHAGLGWMCGESLAAWSSSAHQRAKWVSVLHRSLAGLGLVGCAIALIGAWPEGGTIFPHDPANLLLGGTTPWSTWRLPTVLPLLALVLAAALVARVSRPKRSSHLPDLLPLGLALAAALCLRWAPRSWALVDLMALAAALSTMARLPLPPLRAAGIALLLACTVMPGWRALEKTATTAQSDLLTPAELQQIVLRDYAYTLAARHPDHATTVLAAPGISDQLAYFGNVKVLGTASWANSDGLEAAARIAASTTADEALELMTARGVNTIVLPNWDHGFRALAAWGTAQPEFAFATALSQWNLPNWVRPRPYRTPRTPGFDELGLVIFEVVPAQDDATAVSRLCQYFIDMDDPAVAEALRSSLARFPNSIVATIATAELDLASGNREAAKTRANELTAYLASRAGRRLAWEDRAHAAVVLARVGLPDDARPQIQRCLDQLDASQLDQLSTPALFRFALTMHRLGLSVDDPELASALRARIPPALRGRLD